MTFLTHLLRSSTTRTTFVTLPQQRARHAIINTMARGPLLTDEDRQAVVALLPTHGIRRTAIEIGCDPSLVSRIAQDVGFDIHMWAAKRAQEANHLLSKERRLGLLAGVADHVEEQLGGAKPRIMPKDLRDLAVSLGVVIDKQRLEEGLSSFNAETHIRSWTVKQPPSAQASE